jgi:hypothetical protein
MLTLQRYPGRTLSADCLQAAVRAVEELLGVRPRRRVELIRQQRGNLSGRIQALGEALDDTREADGVLWKRIREAGEEIKQLRSALVDLEAAYQAQGREEKPYSALAKARRQLRSAEKRERRAWRDIQKQQRKRDRQQRELDHMQDDLTSLDEWLSCLETDNQTNLNPVSIVLRIDAGFSTGSNLTWLIEMGYAIRTKAHHSSTADCLRRLVPSDATWTRIGRNAEALYMGGYEHNDCPYPLQAMLVRYHLPERKLHTVLFYYDESAPPPLSEWFAQYNGRQTIEIVYTQMTKRNVRAIGMRWNDVANLYLVVVYDDSVDQQFHQLPSLGKGCLLQYGSNLLTESLNRGSDLAQFDSLGDRGLQLGLLSSQRLLFLSQLLVFALELGQRYHTRQVGFQQAILLPFQLIDGLLQSVPSSTQFLGSPMASMGAFQGVSNDVWLGQHSTQVFPDQFIQLGGWRIARYAPLSKGSTQGIGATSANVVVILGVKGTSQRTEFTLAAADQTAQQVVVDLVVPRRHLLVQGKLVLHTIKRLFGHHRRYCDSYPFFFWPWSTTLSWPNRLQSRLAPLGRGSACAIGVCHPHVSGILQDASHSSDVPAWFSRRGRQPQVCQAFGDTVQTNTRLQIPVEHLRNHGGLRFIKPHPRRVSWMFGIHAITVGRPCPRQQLAGAELGQASTPHPFADLRPLVFCHSSANLQQQPIVRIVTHRAIQEFDANAASLQLLDHHHLMHIVARQSIWLGNQNYVKLGQRSTVSQAVQTRTTQLGSTVPIVSINMLRFKDPALSFYMGTQALNLLLNGLGLRLSLGRHSGIDCHSHHTPPVEFGWTRSPASSSLPISGGTGKPDPNGVGRLHTALLPCELSIPAPSVPPGWVFSSRRVSHRWDSVPRKRSGRRHQLRRSTLQRLKQNLSFVIRPSSSTFAMPNSIGVWKTL